MDKENSKKKIKSIMFNNKIMFILSIIIGLTLWTWICVDKSPEETVTIANVPIAIDTNNQILSELKLEPFGNTKYYVDVDITGKKYIISKITAKDISVTAQTNYVDSAGTKTLRLRANINDDNVKIKSLSRDSIDIFFDKKIEKEFTIQSDVKLSSNNLISSGYQLGSAVLSQNTVTAIGPATEINDIESISAIINIDNTVSKTITCKPEIRIIGNNTFSNTKFKNMDNEITATLPLLKVVTLPTRVEFKNVPEKYATNAIEYNISPKEMKVAVQVENLDKVKNVIAGTIDFSTINNKVNYYNFDIKDLDCVALDNTEKIYVSIDASKYKRDKFQIKTKNISIITSDNKYKVNFIQDNIDDVIIVGKQDELNKLTSKNIYAEINLDNNNLKIGENEIRTSIKLKGVNDSWIYGTYNVKINVE